jgi:uncharacterized protein (UPF0335 family)
MAGGTVAADQLRLFIERIERLEEEKKGIADDVKEVYAEAKANGYDTKTMRAVVRLRKMETHARQEADALLETYRAALGMESDFYRKPNVPQASEPSPLERAIEKTVDAVNHGALDTEDCTVRAEVIRRQNDKADNQPPFDLDEELYAKGVEFVKTQEHIGPSRLQRELRIGWNAAIRYLERMQRDGIVGSPNAMERRDVLERAEA